MVIVKFVGFIKEEIYIWELRFLEEVNIYFTMIIFQELVV